MKFSDMNIWTKSGLTAKMLLVFLALSVVSLAVVGSFDFISIRGVGNYALESSTSLGDQAVSESTTALTEQAAKYLIYLAIDQADISKALFEKVEGEVNIMAEYASHLIAYPPSGATSPEIVDGHPISFETVAPDVNINDVKQELELWRGMDDIFKPILAGNPNLAWVYIGTESGIMRLQPWTSELPSSYDPRNRSWYLRAAETGNIGWSDVYVDAGGRGLMITCSKPVYDEKNKLIGVVAADVTLETLNEAIINTMAGTLGYAFIIDGEGNIIVRPGLTAGDKRWDESFTMENLIRGDNQELALLAKNMIAGKTGINRVTFLAGDKYIAYAPITNTKWSIGIVMPVSEIIAPALATEQQITSGTNKTRAGIDQKINAMRYAFIGALVGVILLVTGLAFVLSRTITRPVLRVTKAARAIEKGEFSE
jgi:hypothetical protein